MFLKDVLGIEKKQMTLILININCCFENPERVKKIYTLE
jgi:hypothetical protein